MKKCSGFSAALLVVFMAHMLWAQERQNRSMEDGRPARQAAASHDGRTPVPPKTRDMSRELEAGTFRSAAPPLQDLRLSAPKQNSHPAGRTATHLPGRAGASRRAARSRAERSLDRARHGKERCSLSSRPSLGAWTFHRSHRTAAYLAAAWRQPRALRRGRILLSGGALRLRRLRRLAVGQRRHRNL